MLVTHSLVTCFFSSPTKILQNLGKVDRTGDEIFDDHLTNFTKQQISANRLQKEFNNYIRCIRGMYSLSFIHLFSCSFNGFNSFIVKYLNGVADSKNVYLSLCTTYHIRERANDDDFS